MSPPCLSVGLVAPTPQHLLDVRSHRRLPDTQDLICRAGRTGGMADSSRQGWGVERHGGHFLVFLGAVHSLGVLSSARGQEREAWLTGPPSVPPSPLLSRPSVCSRPQTRLSGPWTRAPGRRQVEGMARMRASWEKSQLSTSGFIPSAGFLDPSATAQQAGRRQGGPGCALPRAVCSPTLCLNFPSVHCQLQG